MQFFYTTFIILSSILIILLFFVQEKSRIILLNIFATINILLICSSFLLLRYLSGFKQMAEFIGIDVYEALFSTITWEHVRITLIVFLPFLFLFKKLSSSIFLSVVMIFLLLSDLILNLILPNPIGFNFTLINFIFGRIILNFIHYFSWVVFVFALLYFAKRLPSQLINNQSTQFQK